MARIDETKPFLPVRIAVLTVSDTRDASNDTSGDILAARVQAAGHVLVDRTILRDDTDVIAAQLSAWIAQPDVDVVITTGGTGITGRDVTPEALARVMDKTIEGFGELFRMLSYAKIARVRHRQHRDLQRLEGLGFIKCMDHTPTIAQRSLKAKSRKHLFLEKKKQKNFY